MARMQSLPSFDCDAFYRAMDARRIERDLSWYELADELWEQSAELNAERVDDHPLCGGAVKRIRQRGATSCQYGLFMLRWLDQPPEDFLVGDIRDVGDTALPKAGADKRLRWDLSQLHAALNERRQQAGLTWTELAGEDRLHARETDEPAHGPDGGHGPGHAPHPMARPTGGRLRPSHPVVRPTSASGQGTSARPVSVVSTCTTPTGEAHG